MSSDDYHSYDRHEIEREIDKWIFNEEHRQILKRAWLDGIHYEPLSEEFNCSRDKIARLVPKLKQTVLNKLK